MGTSARSVPRIALIVLVVALVALAGCSSNGDGTTASPGDDTTDAPTTELQTTSEMGEPTPEPTDSATDTPTDTSTDTPTDSPGSDVPFPWNTEPVTGDGVAGDHATRLYESGSFTATLNATASGISQSGGSQNVTIGQRMRIDIESRQAVARQTVTNIFGQNSTLNTDRYTSGGETYQRSTSPFTSEAQYNYGTAPYTNSSAIPVNLTQASGAGFAVGVDVTWSEQGSATVDGVSTTRYTASGTESFGNIEGIVGTSVDTVESIEAEIYVDGDGIVRQMTYDVAGTDSDGNDVTLDVSYSISAVGSTSVQEPAWTSEVDA